MKNEKTVHIALVCPGGPITRELAARLTHYAQLQFGDQAALHFHPQCFLEQGHFAGSEAQRSAAFLEVANESKYDAIWFARGGYGAGRLNPDLFDHFNDHARKKIFLGYSDAGVLLARLYALNIGSAVHGPMPTDLERADGDQAIGRALRYLVEHALKQKATHIEARPTVAFNITVLAHMIGADWMPDLEGHVVMLEDVGEYLYRIDRAMGAIISHQRLRAVAGIMLGRISETPENDRPFGQDEEEITQFWCARHGVAYLGRADIGHDAANKIVPFGANADAFLRS